MKRKLLFFFFLSFIDSSLAGNGKGLLSNSQPNNFNSTSPTAQASRWNIKIQPAIFWATLGLETEIILTPKISLGLNLLGKIGNTDGKNVDYRIKKDDFLENGYLAELTGRYYISLSKRKLMLAPLGFYVQASVGYNKLLYFDGSTRPFTLHTRKQRNSETEIGFSQPTPLMGSIGAGYQIDLLPHKVIANIMLGSQCSQDNKGIFISFYVSPSIGLMF